MSAPRAAAVAGRFYPGDAAELGRLVDDLLAAVAPAPAAPPKALIVPHAGYAYSGPVAASGYACLAAGGVSQITTVVLFAPAHRWPVPALALPDAPAFETPLGLVAIDAVAAARAAALDCVDVIPSAHLNEHAVEVQLPFLQRCLPGPFSLVPLVVGQARQAQVLEVMDLLWGGAETLLVISSDLSHFHEYDTARQLDAATSQAIEALAPARVQEGSACGRVSIQALLTAAAQRGLTARTVDQRSSGDTEGGRSEVVGYGAYVIA